jgi:L-amino acid N-acyltransferase YncA
MTLRAATHADIPAIIELGREMHAGSNYAPLDYDPESITATLSALLADSQFVVVAEDDGGGLYGFMFGAVAPAWFGRDYVANDIALFVRPGHGLTAAKLVHVFTRWAAMAGAKQIRPGVSTGNAAAQRLWGGMGYQPAGQIYVMDIEDGGRHAAC